MTFATGMRLGPYEIVSRIGAGGMGEVWRARDTRLDRTVAIKTLPADLAANAQFRLRFDREAKTISQLNHPNICTLHDVGENYLVMEFLEGETLSDRLLRGPLPPHEVLRYGIEIAEALDKAHRQQVTHRDLKPANVMITKTGAKLLDFGLAKSSVVDVPIDGATMQKPLTREGTILGTFQYMAPEQLEGLEADARTDIFSLGAVLYEMATGRRAFEGKTKTSLIAAIVSSRPEPISALQPVIPAALQHVVDKCLEKDPESRWQSAHDIVTELQWISEAGSQVSIAPLTAQRRRRRELTAWSLAAVLAVIAAAAGMVAVREMTRPEKELRFAVAPAEGTNIRDAFDTAGVALSPDGKKLVFAATDENGKQFLYLRALSELTPKVIGETEGASYPFWAPDNRQVAFFADGKLKKVDTAGGPAQIICDAASGRGGVWGKNGTILFAPNVYSGIHSVPAGGGTPSPLTRLDPVTEVTHRWPAWLPNEKDYLFVVRPKQGPGRGPARLMAGTIGSTQTKLVMENATNTVYLDGRLYFGREQRLMSQKFDVKTKTLQGDAEVVVGEKLSFWEPKNFLVYTMSADGTLVYLPEVPPILDLNVMSRDGKLLQQIAHGYLDGGASFSPDQKKVAYSKGDGGFGREDIWIYDVERKQETRFTFEPGAYYSITWSPDGSRLLFGAAHESVGGLYMKPLKGASKPQRLVDTNFWKVPGNMSPDGKRVIYQQQSGETAEDIWVLDLQSGKSEIFLRTRFVEGFPKYSPDGRWVVHSSEESGRSEIYVRPADGSPEQWQVSTTGGFAAEWRPDGKEILYNTQSGAVMTVAVDATNGFATSPPTELFRLPATSRNFSNLQAVSVDGNRILVMSSASKSQSVFHAVMKTK